MNASVSSSRWRSQASTFAHVTDTNRHSTHISRSLSNAPRAAAFAWGSGVQLTLGASLSHCAYTRWTRFLSHTVRMAMSTACGTTEDTSIAAKWRSMQGRLTPGTVTAP